MTNCYLEVLLASKCPKEVESRTPSPLPLPKNWTF